MSWLWSFIWGGAGALGKALLSRLGFAKASDKETMLTHDLKVDNAQINTLTDRTGDDTACSLHEHRF